MRKEERIQLRLVRKAIAEIEQRRKTLTAQLKFLRAKQKVLVRQ
jgi:hypothetical protein